MAKRKSTGARFHRCRAEVAVLSNRAESGRRFGPGALIRSDELEELVAAGVVRAGWFEPAETETEGDDGTTDRT